MELYIVRHGRTCWNELHKLQGAADISLNEDGREAARRLGRELKDVSFDMIFSSPLDRAYETACLIRGPRDIPIRRDDRMQEINFGEIEGVLFEDVLSSGKPCRFLFSDPEHFEPAPGGESLDDVRRRTEDFALSVLEPLYGKAERILVVGHGVVNKGLMCYLEGLDNAHFWGKGLQKNCQADIFSYQGSTWQRIV